MISLKNMYVQREALRKERIVLSFDEEIVYLAIGALEVEVADVEKKTDVFNVSIKSTNPYLGEGLEKLYRFLDLEEIPDNIEIGDPVVNLDDYNNPKSSLIIKVDCDLDDLDTVYGEFVEFLKDRSTNYFARRFNELEEKEAALL